MKDLVSIVIPCYNGERFLRDTLDCCLAQTYQPKEILVINDGSTDGTEEILKSYGDQIRYHTQPNRGLAATRNQGIALAKGEYLYFIDADDLADHDFIEKVIQPLLINPELGASFADTAWFQSDDPERKITTRSHRRKYMKNVHLALFNGFITPGSVVYRRKCLEPIGGFDVALMNGEDADFHYKFSRFWPMEYVEGPLFYYRKYPGSMSTNYLRQWTYNYANFNKHIKRLPDTPEIRRYVAQVRKVRLQAGGNNFRAHLKASRNAPGGLLKGVRDGLKFLKAHPAVFPYIFLIRNAQKDLEIPEMK